MNIIFIIGRILLGGFFLVNAYGHLRNVNMLAGYAQSRKVPAPHITVIVTGLMLAIGGLSLLFNVKMIIGVWILVAFMVPVTVIMHPFWKEKDPIMRMNDRINFLKNVAILGSLLIIASLGIF